MNKLQALLIAGLLSLTSVSFASSITYTGSTSGVVADVLMKNGDPEFTFGIAFDSGNLAIDATAVEIAAAKTQIYTLTNENYDGKLTSIGASYVVDPFATEPLSLMLYADLALTMLVSGDGSDTLMAHLLADTKYYLQVIESGDIFGSSPNIKVSTVPVPAAGILFASALFGAGALGRRKKKAKASVVGAFARAS